MSFLDRKINIYQKYAEQEKADCSNDREDNGRKDVVDAFLHHSRLSSAHPHIVKLQLNTRLKNITFFFFVWGMNIDEN